MSAERLAASDWLEVSQERINQFAEATEDRQWIHIDVERAARESPFKETYRARLSVPFVVERTGQKRDVCWRRADGH